MKNMAKNADFFGNSPLGLHSADFGIFGDFADFSLVSAPKIPKNHKSQTENHSVVDSARYAESSEKIKSKKPIKSFCYFWLSPKVESPLPLNHNLPNSAESTKSQNLVNFNSCEAPENSPASWCKKSGEASSSASTDFLLEAEKRGSPPKSEKAAAFWRVGGAGRGVQPFLRKESSEISGVRVAESNADSANSQNLQNGLPRRFCESARNDENRDSSLASLSQNDNLNDFAESRRKSHKNKRIILW